MSEKEQRSAASLVAIGTIVRVRPHGKRYQDHCYHWQRYAATFRVTSRLKGKSARIITIVFATRGGDVNPKRRCVGGRTSYYLSPRKKHMV